MLVHISAFHGYAVFERGMRSGLRYEVLEVQSLSGEKAWPVLRTFRGPDSRSIAINHANALEDQVTRQEDALK